MGTRELQSSLSGSGKSETEPLLSNPSSFNREYTVGSLWTSHNFLTPLHCFKRRQPAFTLQVFVLAHCSYLAFIFTLRSSTALFKTLNAERYGFPTKRPPYHQQRRAEKATYLSEQYLSIVFSCYHEQLSNNSYPSHQPAPNIPHPPIHHKPLRHRPSERHSEPRQWTAWRYLRPQRGVRSCREWVQWYGLSSESWMRWRG